MKTLNKIAAALAFSATLSAGAFAAPQSYSLDANHSFPRFSYNHLGMSEQASRFNKMTGTIVLDKAAHTGSVEISIDAKSVDTGSDLFNGHIQGEEFFDTAKFPTLTFKSTKVVFEGDKPTTIEGNLTIKGVTKPVTLTVTHFVSQPHPMNKAEAIGANATAVVKRSEFNMSKYVPYVSDDVNISISLEAVAK